MDFKICRICLTNPGTISLFDKQNDMEHSEKLMKCVNIVISVGDGFSDTICEACAYELAITYNFILKCETSNNLLRKEFVLYQRQEDPEIKEEKDMHYGLKKEGNEKLKAVFPCDMCNAMFVIKDSLRKHKSIHHATYKKGRKRRGSNPTQCGVCGLVVQTRSAMDIHLRTHTGEKPFTCNICDLKFSVRSSLKRHIKTHNTDNYICDICNGVFLSKFELVEHMKIHNKGNHETYACDLCPKTYRQLSSVLRHQLSHTGDRRHQCPECHKLFYRKYDVHRHMKSMHGDRQYSCHMCEKILKNENLLTSHLKTHGNVEAVDF